jgi:hypothetical protein
VQQVRLGGEIVELTDDEFAVWSSAHGLNEEKRARHAEELLARSLLADVGPDSPNDFAARHRLLPLQLGLGNTPEAPAMFRSGTAKLPLTGMTRNLYDLWLSSHLSPNLLIACKEHDTNPSAVLTVLHALLAHSAACLDLATTEYQP